MILLLVLLSLLILCSKVGRYCLLKMCQGVLVFVGTFGIFIYGAAVLFFLER